MSHSLIRAAAGFAVALLAIALPQHSRPQAEFSARAPVSGVEQARVDSLRRPYTAADIEFMSGNDRPPFAGREDGRSCCASHGANLITSRIFCGRIALGQDR